MRSELGDRLRRWLYVCLTRNALQLIAPASRLAAPTCAVTQRVWYSTADLSPSRPMRRARPAVPRRSRLTGNKPMANRMAEGARVFFLPPRISWPVLVFLDRCGPAQPHREREHQIGVAAATPGGGGSVGGGCGVLSGGRIGGTPGIGSGSGPAGGLGVWARITTVQLYHQSTCASGSISEVEGRARSPSPRTACPP